MIDMCLYYYCSLHISLFSKLLHSFIILLKISVLIITKTKKEVKKNMSLQSVKVEKWISIAQQNPWIRMRGSGDANDICAFEPALTQQDFYECLSIEELYDLLTQGNWILGQPFYFQNLCLVNQINAGDEWLVIRDGLAFESLTAGAMEYEEFKDWIACVFIATEEQLHTLEYISEGYVLKWREF
jgi:hypothetical protein